MMQFNPQINCSKLANLSSNQDCLVYTTWDPGINMFNVSNIQPPLHTLDISSTSLFSNSTSVFESVLSPSSSSTSSLWASSANNWHVLPLCLIVLAGIMGNVLVCMAVATEKKLQNVTNYFLTSLAIADLFVCCVVMPLSIMFEFMGVWPLGLAMCTLWQVTDVMMCTSSIMHMCVISIDRYLTMRRPLSSRNKTRASVAAKMAAVWIISLATASPIIVLSILTPEDILNQDHQCGIFNSYFVVSGSLTAFFIPLAIMAVAYMLTILLLNKQSKKCLRRGSEGMRRTRSRRKFFNKMPTPASQTNNTNKHIASNSSNSFKNATKRTLRRLSTHASMSTFTNELEPLHSRNRRSPISRQVSNASSTTTCTMLSPKPSIGKRTSFNLGNHLHPNSSKQQKDNSKKEQTCSNCIQLTDKSDKDVCTCGSSPKGVRSNKVEENKSKYSILGKTADDGKYDDSGYVSMIPIDHHQQISTNNVIINHHSCSGNNSSSPKTSSKSTRSINKSSYHSKRERKSPKELRPTFYLSTKPCDAVNSESQSNVDDPNNCITAVGNNTSQGKLRQGGSPFCNNRAAALNNRNGLLKCDQTDKLMAQNAKDLTIKEVVTEQKYTSNESTKKSLILEQTSIGKGCSSGGDGIALKTNTPQIVNSDKNTPKINHSTLPTISFMSPETNCNTQENNQPEKTSAPKVSLWAKLANQSVITDRENNSTNSLNDQIERNPNRLSVQSCSSNNSIGNGGKTECSIVGTSSYPLQNKTPSFRDLVQKHQATFKVAGILMAKREQKNTVRTEQKAIKVLGTMFVIFFICWAPFFTINFAMGLCRGCDIEIIVFKVFLWLGYFGSTLNPIIYTVFNKNFRNFFIRKLTCGKCDLDNEKSTIWTKSSGNYSFLRNKSERFRSFRQKFRQKKDTDTDYCDIEPENNRKESNL